MTAIGSSANLIHIRKFACSPRIPDSSKPSNEESITYLPLDVDYTTTNHNYIKYLAENLPELGPYPTYSKYVNPRHFYHNTVMDTWISKKAHPVSLKQLANYGKKLTLEKVLLSANFVRMEIAIRITKKLQDLQKLPFGAVSNHHLVKVYETYYNIFEIFRKIKPITTLEENDLFCQSLAKMLTDNVLSLPHLIMGSLEISVLQLMTREQLDDFMSATLRARISRRLICEEHLSLTDRFKTNNVDNENDYIGDIFYQCSAIETLKACGEQIVKDIERSRRATNDTVDAEYKVPKNMLLPELLIEGDDVKFPFMVTHLRYIFGEILRNSYEATLKNFIFNNGDKDESWFAQNKPPPIVITIITNEKTSVGFRFSDKGGGIKSTPIDQIWSFAKDERYSRISLANFHKLPNLQHGADFMTNETNQSESGKQISETNNTSSEGISAKTLNSKSVDAVSTDSRKIKRADVASSLQKLIERPTALKINLGLAICKVYADYWNGSICMNSLENYGSDTFLTLQRLGMNDNLQLDKA